MGLSTMYDVDQRTRRCIDVNGRCLMSEQPNAYDDESDPATAIMRAL